MSAPHRFTRSRVLAALAGLAAFAVVALGLAIRFGEQPVDLGEVWQEGSTDATIFWSLRLPRALLAALVGAALAASGCVLQGLTRNPLADPFVLGVSGGAALGATVSLAVGALVGLGGAVLGLATSSLFALGGALGSMVLVLALGRAVGRSSPHALLLAGVVFNAFALAMVTFIKTVLVPDKLGEVLYWLAGAIGNEEPWVVGAALVVEGVAVGAMWLSAGRLNLLSLGDEQAASLGVAVEPTRLWLLLLSSLAVGVAVSLAGLVGFVGLLVPHVLRLALGPDQRLLLPASALGGAGFLALADLLARVAFVWLRRELPVGVVTALLGVPLFFLLLYRRGAAFRLT